MLNVNAVLVLALPLSLNTTPVLEPGITILPEILPETLPTKVVAITLPTTVKLLVASSNVKLELAPKLLLPSLN